MKNPLKILQIIVQNKLRSGGAIQMFHLAKELSRRGHRVCAVYNKKGLIEEDFTVFDNTGIDLRFLEMGRLAPTTRSLSAVLSLRRLIREYDFDIIHAHKGNAVDLVVCATLGMNMPIVTNRGVNIPLHFFQSLKYRTHKVKKIIAVSQAVKEVMVKTGHISLDKIAVIYGSVDTDRFNPEISSSLRDELALDNDIRIIGFVGNSHPRKGLRYLLRSFENLCRTYENVALVLLGVSEKDFMKYETEITRRNRVFPVGFRKDVPNCMASFDVYVFPGIRDEGLTGSLREAACMGLPVITTDVAGNGELIVDGYNGLVIPPGDTDALTAALSYMLENHDDARTFGQRAREFIVTHMSNSIRVDAVESIYYNVLHS
ncbi:glycosyltransferase family 4 protein [bacterium]|nr:glycosyltransferase family 4 protein [bacterium]